MTLSPRHRFLHALAGGLLGLAVAYNLLGIAQTLGGILAAVGVAAALVVAGAFALVRLATTAAARGKP